MSQQALVAFNRLFDTFLISGVQELTLSQLPEADQRAFHKRQSELHPSSLPICPLRLAYERHLQPSDPPVYNSFSQSYFLNVGTLAHSLIQNWLGVSGKIVGNWKCNNCSTNYRFCVYPQTCRSCKQHSFTYIELGGKEDNVSWHTDGLFLHKDEYFLLDYKTTGDEQLEKHAKSKDVFPYKANQFQIEAYVPIVEKKYNIKISGYMLAYISRSTPNKSHKRFVYMHPIDDGMREKWRERLERFKKAHTLGISVTETPVRVFKKAIETKLCEDEEFYKDQVYSFFDPCPLAENGKCFSRKALIKEVKSIL